MTEGDELKSETTDEDGNTITTVTQTTTTEGTLDNGASIEGEETYTETTKTDPEGNMLQNEATLDGQEVAKLETEEITPEDTDLPKVDVTISPDMEPTEEPVVEKETVVEGDMLTETTTETTVVKTENGTQVTVNLSQIIAQIQGDVAGGNYTGVGTEIDREVVANIGQVVIVAEHHSNSDLKALEPHMFKGPSSSSYFNEYEEKDAEGNVVKTYWYPKVERTQEEYDLLPQEVKDTYTKLESGMYAPASGNTYSTLANGINWDTVVSNYYGSSTGTPVSVETSEAHSPYLIVLSNKAGEVMSSFCLDVETGTNTGYRYIFENLADVDYFQGTPEEQEEAKEHVRAIALSGYWGTAEGTGSLKYLQDNMTEALNDANFTDVITYQDAEGNSYSLDPSNPEDREKLKNVIGTITESDAIAAMQSAFWAYGRSKDSVNGIKANNNSAEIDLRLELIRSYLISNYLKDKVNTDLEAEKAEKETTIIDQNAFLTKEGITLSVGDKVQVVEDVTEDDGSDYSSDNGGEKKDVYEVDISFAMVVEPDPVTDNLVVSLIDASGNIVRKARLAGDASKDDESFSGITKGENGSYTFEDLHLAEGTDFTFDLNLEGVQYLEKGVYIYKSVSGYTGGQTLVGVAEGEHNVDVSARFTVNFEVTESKSIVATRKWHKTTDPGNKPGNTPPPARYRLTRGVGQLEIIDEEVPLAEPPQTGDISMLWFAMIVMSACGLCMLNLFERKREQA